MQTERCGGTHDNAGEGSGQGSAADSGTEKAEQDSVQLAAVSVPASGAGVFPAFPVLPDAGRPDCIQKIQSRSGNLGQPVGRIQEL